MIIGIIRRLKKIVHLCGKTQARRDGDPEASCCNGSVSHIFIHCTNHTLRTSEVHGLMRSLSLCASFNG